MEQSPNQRGPQDHQNIERLSGEFTDEQNDMLERADLEMTIQTYRDAIANNNQAAEDGLITREGADAYNESQIAGLRESEAKLKGLVESYAKPESEVEASPGKRSFEKKVLGFLFKKR